jgi:hypothetical protein
LAKHELKNPLPAAARRDRLAAEVEPGTVLCVFRPFTSVEEKQHRAKHRVEFWLTAALILAFAVALASFGGMLVYDLPGQLIHGVVTTYG